MIGETNNLNYLRRDDDLDNKSDYRELWFTLQDEYLEDYGDKEALRKMLTLKRNGLNNKLSL